MNKLIQRDLYCLPGYVSTAKKILMLIGDNAGPGYHRMRKPAYYINKEYNSDYNCLISNILDQRDIAPDPSDVKWDIIIGQRQEKKYLCEGILRAKTNYGTKYIYEIDDDIFNMDPANALTHLFTPERLEEIRYCIERADAMIVSTEPLIKAYSKYNKNIHVIPNNINFDLVDSIQRKEDKYTTDEPIIGWFGSGTHGGDLHIALEAVGDVLRRYPKVKFLLGGPNPQDVPGMHCIPEGQLVCVPWSNEIPTYMSNLAKIDIGIMPLDDNTFNECKSNIKYLEYSSMGIPSIGSDSFPYRKSIREDRGILVKNIYKAWIAAIELLINDKALRERLGTTAEAFTRKNYNVHRFIPKYLNVFDNLLLGGIDTI